MKTLIFLFEPGCVVPTFMLMNFAVITILLHRKLNCHAGGLHDIMFHVKQLTVSEAGQEDYTSIHALIKKELGYPHVEYEKLRNRLDIMKSDARHSTIVAKLDGRVAGFIGMVKGVAYNIDGEILQITALAVLEEMQNKGIGAKLLESAEEFAISNNIQIITLTSRLHRAKSHSFYEGRGYEKKSFGFRKEL